MYNKLRKQAYLIRRLRDSGYSVERDYSGYSEVDPRIWTMVINPYKDSIMCTCFANNGEADGIDIESSCFFEMYDGGQYIPGRLKVDTSSFEVFVTYLMKLGIKPVYDNRSPQRRY